MLSFDLQALESRAARVDGSLSADDDVWQEGDSRPGDGVHVTGRLSSAGPGRFYFSGRLDGSVETTCRRCLIDVTASVSSDAHLLFVDGGEDGVADEPDVYLIDLRDRALDLGPAIREEWLLSVPSLVLCKDDCLGLCPKCGGDRNLGACTCAPTLDPRWAALGAADDVIR